MFRPELRLESRRQEQHSGGHPLSHHEATARGAGRWRPAGRVQREPATDRSTRRPARALGGAAAGAPGQRPGPGRLVGPFRRPGAQRLDRARPAPQPRHRVRPGPGVRGARRAGRGRGAGPPPGECGGHRQPGPHRREHAAGHHAERGGTGLLGRGPVGRGPGARGQRAGPAGRRRRTLARGPRAGGVRGGAALFRPAPVPRTTGRGAERPRLAPRHGRQQRRDRARRPHRAGTSRRR